MLFADTYMRAHTDIRQSHLDTHLHTSQTQTRTHKWMLTSILAIFMESIVVMHLIRMHAVPASGEVGKWVTIWHIFVLVHRTRTHARIHAHTNFCWLPNCHTEPFSFNLHLELCYPQLAQLSTHSYITLSVTANTIVYAWAALQMCGLSMRRLSVIVHGNVLPQSEPRNCSTVRMTLCVVDMHHDQAGYLLLFAAVCVLATAHAWCSSREAREISSAR